MPVSVIDRIHAIATKKSPNGINFMHSDNTPIILLTSDEEIADNTTTASKGVEDADNNGNIGNDNANPNNDPDAFANILNSYESEEDIDIGNENITINNNPDESNINADAVDIEGVDVNDAGIEEMPGNNMYDAGTERIIGDTINDRNEGDDKNDDHSTDDVNNNTNDTMDTPQQQHKN